MADTKQQAERAEQARAAHAGGVEGAQSVAEAVKKVADAAVAEVQKFKAGPAADLTASGSAGGRLHILGNGFSTGGTVKLNGVQVHTIGWSNERIEGRLPAEAKSGPLEVHVDENTVRRGYLAL